MIQDPRIIDNIKKLKELGMSNDDIKDNLIKMGLSSDDCDELIAASNEDENKNRKLQEKEQKKEKIKKEEIFSEPKKNEPAEIPETLFQEDNKIDALKEEVSFTIKDDFSEIPDLTSGLDVDQLNNSDTDINFNAPDLSREE
jgi:phage FluMu gp28-like protein